MANSTRSLLLAALICASASCFSPREAHRTPHVPPGPLHADSDRAHGVARPVHLPGSGYPLMVAPWEGASDGGLVVTGVGYSPRDQGPDEASARDMALDDAHGRAIIMMGTENVRLIEDQVYMATSTTHLGIKILYRIMD